MQIGLQADAITGCSNVTGIQTPYHKVAQMVHTYGGLCFVGTPGVLIFNNCVSTIIHPLSQVTLPNKLPVQFFAFGQLESFQFHRLHCDNKYLPDRWP